MTKDVVKRYYYVSENVRPKDVIEKKDKLFIGSVTNGAKFRLNLLDILKHNIGSEAFPKCKEILDLICILENLEWFLNYDLPNGKTYDEKKLQIVKERNRWLMSRRKTTRVGNIDVFSINIPVEILTVFHIWLITLSKKFEDEDGNEVISDILYENITFDTNVLDTVEQYQDIRRGVKLETHYPFVCEMYVGNILCTTPSSANIL